MDSITRKFYELASSLNNAHTKALANYLFREVIEEAHRKYDITQADMKKMCKTSVNRAALYIKLCDDPKLKRAFLIEAMVCSQWDEPEVTPHLLEEQKFFEDIARKLDL